MRVTEISKDFDAQKFVDNLLENGSKIEYGDPDICDKCELPPFYDEQLFKKGQQFFHKNIFAMFFAKLNGLLAVLAVPSILKILIFTRKSNTDYSAYVRYISTTFHMVIWYKEEFKPGSRLWKSLSNINMKHSSASMNSGKCGFNKITQMDLALTQFGFMGFQIARANMIGIHYATEEEFRAFIHVWKVVGYMMGIEDRFNICRDSVTETREICNNLINQIYYPRVSAKDEDFLNMSRHLIRGMWTMHPMLEFKVIMNYLHILVKPLHYSKMNNNNNNNKQIKTEEYFQLSYVQEMHFNLIDFTIKVLLKYTIFSWFFNYLKHLSLWLMKVCPFLAYYSFGKENSMVEINI